MIENPDLVRILPELKGPKVDVYFVYPEELRNSKRVAVFRDFLLARLGANPLTSATSVAGTNALTVGDLPGHAREAWRHPGFGVGKVCGAPLKLTHRIRRCVRQCSGLSRSEGGR